jgi:hypothetical protein
MGKRSRARKGVCWYVVEFRLRRSEAKRTSKVDSAKESTDTDAVELKIDAVVKKGTVKEHIVRTSAIRLKQRWLSD